MTDSELFNSPTHLILGGARSGKSAYAEQKMTEWSQHSAGSVFYLATAPSTYMLESDDSSEKIFVEDSEMKKRIDHHKRQRPIEWLTLEEPLNLAGRLQELERNAEQGFKTAVLIDCLTLWMLNIIEADCREQQVNAFLRFLENTNLNLIMVSNEIGLGVVPMGKLSREFVDELGRLHQAVAKRAEQVTFVTAGLPMRLK